MPNLSGNFFRHALLFLLCTIAANAAPIDDAADLATQQAQEKMELEEMKQEINNIKGTMQQGIQGMEQLRQQVNQQRAKIQEVHLIAKESVHELCPGVYATALTFNGQTPGPIIRLAEGDQVKIVLHNQMKTPTSLYFHGMTLPYAVDGLPRKEAGLVAPGETFAYQFVATVPGTYWYHPQAPNLDQLARGLYGAIVVEPSSMPKTYERDQVLVIGQFQAQDRQISAQEQKAARESATKAIKQSPNAEASGATMQTVNYFTINGKCAPANKPIEVKNGERIRFRFINASQQTVPLFISGHKFEIVATNGSESLEPHVSRDSFTMFPGDRYDLELITDNPGTWSLSSMLPVQNSNNGRFPGGLATVIKYIDQPSEKSSP